MEGTTAAPVYISPADVAELVPGVTENALRQMRYEGRGPAFYKFGRKVVYRRDEVIEFVESQRRTSTAASAT